MQRSANSFSLSVAILAVLAACGGKETKTQDLQVTGGDPRLGEMAIRRYGCGACHKIPGIPGANGIVGPPLADMAGRAYLAGKLANTPENMVRWLLNPPELDSSTAMPAMGLTGSDARHIAAYLYTLR